tara:strand:- start:1319 stop:1936 length:618 start_codon:yes stop_codon:yes gene_type:complete
MAIPVFTLYDSCYQIEETLISPESQTTTPTGIVKTARFGINHYLFKITLIGALTLEQRSKLRSFFLDSKANSSKAYLPLTSLYNASGSNSNAIAVKTEHSSGNQVTIDGFSNSTNGVLKAGDIIQFTNHKKLYTVKEDVNSSNTGEATIKIDPPLLATVLDNEVVSHSDLQAHVTLLDNNIKTTLNIGNMASSNVIKFREIVDYG